MIELVFEFILVGLVGGLLGLFYRNCLKPSSMIFNFIYYGWLKPWAECTEDIVEAGFKPKAWDKFKAWIARPLGYCIYCSTFWITFILCIIAGSYKEGWNSYSEMLIAYITALSVQHLVVAMSCRWLINKHPDLDTTV